MDNPGVLEKFRQRGIQPRVKLCHPESKKNRKGREEIRNPLELRLLSLSLPPIKIKDLDLYQGKELKQKHLVLPAGKS